MSEDKKEEIGQRIQEREHWDAGTKDSLSQRHRDHREGREGQESEVGREVTD